MSLKDAYFCHRHLLRTCLYTEYFLPWKLCTLNKPNKCIFNNIFCFNRFYQYISICLHVMFKMVAIKGGIASVHLCLLSLFLNTCMMYTETVCIYLFHKKLEFTNHMGTTYPLHCRYNPNHYVILILKVYTMYMYIYICIFASQGLQSTLLIFITVNKCNQ